MRTFGAAILAAGLAGVLLGCAQQEPLSAGVPLASNARVAHVRGPDVAGWQGGLAEVAGAPNAPGAQAGRKSRAARVLAAIALQRVTGRSIDPGRLAHDE